MHTCSFQTIWHMLTHQHSNTHTHTHTYNNAQTNTHTHTHTHTYTNTHSFVLSPFLLNLSHRIQNRGDNDCILLVYSHKTTSSLRPPSNVIYPKWKKRKEMKKKLYRHSIHFFIWDKHNLFWGPNSTEVAFELHTQLSRVQITVFQNDFFLRNFQSLGKFRCHWVTQQLSLE